VAPLEAAARTLKIEQIPTPVHSDAEIETVITSLGREPTSGLVVLAVIMRHMARFCMSVERARAGDPTSWIGVRPLAV